jgi:putative flippase GtrA
MIDGPASSRMTRWATSLPGWWDERRATVIHLMRCAAVSLVATATSLVILGALVGVFRLSATRSNVAATGIGTVPSFELNRRWVWGHAPSQLTGSWLPG